MELNDLAHGRARATRSRRKPLMPAVDAEWLQRAQAVPGLRMDRVQAIRAALMDGTYDIDGKVQSFVARCEEGQPLE